MPWAALSNGSEPGNAAVAASYQACVRGDTRELVAGMGPLSGETGSESLSALKGGI